MPSISRRQFLNRTALGLTAAGCLAPTLGADPLGLPIGCQVYPVREALGKDFEGTLAQLASIGYRMIEMCSPAGYEKAGFAPLVSKKGAEIRHGVHASGEGGDRCRIP